MTITECAALNPALTTSDIIAALPRVVKMLRLDPIIVPLLLTSNSFRFGGLDNTGLVGTDSEIAFKEVSHIFACTFTDTLDIAKEYCTVTAGDVTEDDYGFSTNYDTYADEDYEDFVPELYVSGNEITVNNWEDSPGVVILLAIVYAYPHLLPTDPYNNTVVYDSYDVDTDADPLLLSLCAIESLRNFYSYNGYVVYEGKYLNLLNSMINKYNSNLDNMFVGFSSFDLNLGSGYEL